MIALVQRKRRKRHLAVTRRDGTMWDTLGSCRLSIPVHGTDFTTLDNATSIGTAMEQDVTICVHCLTLIAFAHILERGTTTTTTLRRIA